MALILLPGGGEGTILDFYTIVYYIKLFVYGKIMRRKRGNTTQNKNIDSCVECIGDVDTVGGGGEEGR